ncbi:MULTISPECIES: 50S ribosomal protein L25/general stress protein Ctc [unclassified Enterococcus]|uniref:50S ribosomal protein L25/general stress protein Ctc n=1 Tax=unclassified Enterococcus TaxID=2608891 RepID=UPI000A356768|nr:MULTISPECIES: 50S ribosomal protein L25/general stress protein Ctc [unclassified Enterococcus]MBO0425379.1 50S ribosomal protein L25/general stress protein Ctc [Enterococcus faecium]OTO33044.1 ribosomal protein L25, Ctc-form [Enterococcus sp. 2G9_DIV0600]OTO36473.1 ribosomal protein L25, Ctc-form [Enterococcus sp. 2F9_DIV0599]
MSVSLEVTKREVRPRSLRNKLRHEGKVPAIVNGYKVESTPIAVNAAELEKILRENGLNTVITISLEGKKANTLIKEYQSDTFTRNLTHVEFLSVDMNEETEVEAEVTLIGESAGVKAGGVLAQNLYTVVVSATPDKLPERVEIDVTSLEIGDSLTVADLPKNDEYTIVTDPEEQIVAVTEPQEISEDEEAGEAAEPAVIGEDEE